MRMFFGNRYSHKQRGPMNRQGQACVVMGILGCQDFALRMRLRRKRLDAGSSKRM